MHLSPEEVTEKTRLFVKGRLQGEGFGHDWWHIVRVTNTAAHLAVLEDANLFVVELAALLHDIEDWKFHNGDDEVGPKAARSWLESLGQNEEIIAHVCEIMRTISFKKGRGTTLKMKTLEGMIVQDADRLDALGAIGIARVFTFGGFVKQEMHDPAVTTGTTITHFHEKLLLLKDLMNTRSAREMAAGRHAYMEDFLERFNTEWDGKL